jgi:hypothetical protein
MAEKPLAMAAFMSGVGFVVVVVVVVDVVFSVDGCDAFPLSCSAVARNRSAPSVEDVFALVLELEVLVVVVVTVVERAGGGEGS